jgi:hypothetical protein
VRCPDMKIDSKTRSRRKERGYELGDNVGIVHPRIGRVIILLSGHSTWVDVVGVCVGKWEGRD